MGTQVPSAAKLLAHAKIDVTCYGCSGGGRLFREH
jgi:maleate cis-trans isomerase